MAFLGLETAFNAIHPVRGNEEPRRLRSARPRRRQRATADYIGMLRQSCWLAFTSPRRIPIVARCQRKLIIFSLRSCANLRRPHSVSGALQATCEAT